MLTEAASVAQEPGGYNCPMSAHTVFPDRVLGRGGPLLSPLGFGCMGLVGWYGTRDDEEARATLLAAIERGIVHLDTASSYQNGANERFVGQTVAGLPRERLFVASKYGITRNSAGDLVIDNAPATLRSAVDTSLQRLGFDYLDLYYLHRIDLRVPIEESVGALAELVHAGKIRGIGLSECSVATLRRAHAVHPISAVQSEYSLWSREPEQEMLETCRELGVAFVAYSPLGRGFLAGNFRDAEELPAGDARRNQPRFTGENVLHNQRLVDALRDIAQRRGCSAPQLALAWVLGAGEQVFTIPGMKRRNHLDDNLGALDVALSAAERAELAALADHHGTHGERHAPAMMSVVDR